MLELLINPAMVKCCGRILLLSLLLTSCAGFVPRNGDLVFQTEGPSEFSGAISASSATGGSKAFCKGSYDDTKEIKPNPEPVYVHVGIAVVEEGRVYVLEANPYTGVVMTPWDDFVADSPLIDGKPGISVMRLTAEFPLDEAIGRAKTHLGEVYDWHFLPENGQMYCSELVYESYLHEDGSHIFPSVPMNFRDPEGKIPEFWAELFASFNEPIPEGIPGTNPSGLSRDPLLKEVHRFF